MPETKKMIGRNEGRHGSDEPEILPDALGNQVQHGAYRGSAERREKRAKYAPGRVRKAADRPRERDKVPKGK